MFLIAPRHSISSLSGGALSPALLYDLTNWRESHSGLVGRVSSQLGYTAIVLVALVELVIRIPFAFFSRCCGSEKGIKGFQMTIETLGLAVYSCLLNLFAQQVTHYLTSFHASLYQQPEIALFTAAAYGDQSLCQHLLNKGADPHKKMGIYTASMAPFLFNQPHLQKQLPLSTYEKEYFDTKLIAAWHNLEGTVEIEETKIDLQGAKIAFHSLFLGDYLSKFFSIHQADSELSKENQLLLTRTLMENSDGEDYLKTAHNIRNGTLTFVDTGWEMHGISVAFFGNYMAIGNRGPGSDQNGTLAVYQVDRSKVNASLIEEMKAKQHVSEKEGIFYFYHILPARLSPTGKPLQDSLCSQMKQLAPKRAKSNNCALSSKKAAMRFAWAMLLDDQPNFASLQQTQKEVKLFSDWAAVRIGDLEPPSLNRPQLLKEKTSSISRKFFRYYNRVRYLDKKAYEISLQAFQIGTLLHRSN